MYNRENNQSKTQPPSSSQPSSSRRPTLTRLSLPIRRVLAPPTQNFRQGPSALRSQLRRQQPSYHGTTNPLATQQRLLQLHQTQQPLNNPFASQQWPLQRDRMNPSANTVQQTSNRPLSVTNTPLPPQTQTSQTPSLQTPSHGANQMARPLDPFSRTQTGNFANQQPTNVTTRNPNMDVSNARGAFDAMFQNLNQMNNVGYNPLQQQQRPSTFSTYPPSQPPQMMPSTTSLNPQLARLMPSSFTIAQPPTRQFVPPPPSSFFPLPNTQQYIPAPTSQVLPVNQEHDDDEDDDDDEKDYSSSNEDETDAQKIVRYRDVQGLTYREIKIKGKFKQTESTLRGKYRAAKKRREERLRRPPWSKSAEDDLQSIVGEHLARIRDDRTRGRLQPLSTEELLNKIVWRDVAAELAVRGGGHYHYGPATAKKKYRELVGLSNP